MNKRIFRISNTVTTEVHTHEPKEGGDGKPTEHSAMIVSLSLDEIKQGDRLNLFASVIAVDKNSARTLYGPTVAKDPVDAATVVTGKLINGWLDNAKALAGEDGMLLGAESVRHAVRDALTPFFIE